MSLWVVLSLLSAFSLATSDAFAKKAVAGENEYLVAFFRLFFTLPVLVPILLLVPAPSLDRDFWIATIIALPLETITVVLYIKALKHSQMSLALPFLSLTPVFLIVNSYVILGEKVTVQGGLGIFLIAAGGYLLNTHYIKEGLSAPVKRLLRDTGVIMIMIVAFLYSFTASLGKMAIEHSSPLFFASFYYILLNIVVLPVALWKGKNEIRQFLGGGAYRRLLVPGIFYALMIVTHMLAMKLTKVAYMVSVKRTSLLISVLYGYYLFGEENLRGRLIGSLLMFAGFVLVVTAH